MKLGYVLPKAAGADVSHRASGHSVLASNIVGGCTARTARSDGQHVRLREFLSHREPHAPREVAPCFAGAGHADGGDRHAVVSRDAREFLALGPTATHVDHCALRDKSPSVSLSTRVPPLADHVGVVLLVRAQEQMCRVAAGWVVAAVADLHAGRDGPVRRFEREPVNKGCAVGAGVTRSAVPLRARTGSPQPTPAVRLRPDVLRDALGKCVDHRIL